MACITPHTIYAFFFFYHYALSITMGGTRRTAHLHNIPRCHHAQSSQGLLTPRESASPCYPILCHIPTQSPILHITLNHFVPGGWRPTLGIFPFHYHVIGPTDTPILFHAHHMSKPAKSTSTNYFLNIFDF